VKAVNAKRPKSEVRFMEDPKESRVSLAARGAGRPPRMALVMRELAFRVSSEPAITVKGFEKPLARLSWQQIFRCLESADGLYVRGGSDLSQAPCATGSPSSRWLHFGQCHRTLFTFMGGG
jgi:hypothetical protein